MEIVLTLMREITMMALLIGLGVYTKKSGILSREVAERLAEFLISVIMPIILINTFQRDKNPALMPGLWMAMILAAFVFVVSAVAVTFAFRKKDDSADYKIARLAAAMPNCGFMGIPLLLATTGEDSLLYCAGLLGVFQMFTWIWGIPMLDGKMPPLKRILVNPGVLAFIAGLAMFLLQIRLPAVVMSFMSQVTSVNTPLSMIMTGIFLADLKLGDAFSSPIVYKAVLLRNLVIPAATVFFMYAIGITTYFGKTFSLSFIIIIACSSAASTLLLPLRIGEDGSRASQMIAASSLSSIVTLPLVALLAEKIL